MQREQLQQHPAYLALTPDERAAIDDRLGAWQLDTQAVAALTGGLDLWSMKRICVSAVFLLGCQSDSPDLPDDLAGSVASIEMTLDRACAVSNAGELRCWGVGAFGTLGLGAQCGDSFESDLPRDCIVGDDEAPSWVPELGFENVRQVALGAYHTCVLLEGGSVRCWGLDAGGAVLGQPGVSDGIVGDDESPNSLPDVDVGASVIRLAAGRTHTCAMTDEATVRCWGFDDGSGGRLGHGTSDSIGDDDTPASWGDVPVGGPIRAVAVSADRTCVVLIGGTLRCWGEASLPGLLGYGTTQVVNSTPALAGDVPVPVVVVDVALSPQASCVLDPDGNVWCWGLDRYLGDGTDGFETVMAEDAVQVGLGASAATIVGGANAVCALTTTGGVRCWGEINGYVGGNIGGDLPGALTDLAELGDIDLGAAAVRVVVGGWLGACAVTEDGHARCWGDEPLNGHPGSGMIGDDEPPSALGDVDVFASTP